MLIPEGPPENIDSVVRLLRLAKPYMLQLGVVSFLMIIGTSFGMTLPFIAGFVIDFSIGEGGNVQNLTKYILILISFLVLMSSITYLTTYWLGKIGAEFLQSIRMKLFDKLINMPQSFYAENKVGDLNSRLVQSISVIHRVIVFQIPKGIQCVFRLNIAILMLFALQIKMTLVAMILIPIIVLVGFLFGKRLQRAASREQNALADSAGYVEEVLSGVQTVQAFAQEKREQREYRSFLGSLFKVQVGFANTMSQFSALVQFLTFCSLALVFWFGGYLLINHALTAGELTTYILYAVYMAVAIVEMGMHYSAVKELAGAGERVFQILDENCDLADTGSMTASDVSSCDIAFNKVSFSYRKSQEKPVFSSFSFKIRDGETVALVGPSGSGKTTLTQLMMRFYDPTSGEVTIGGVPIRKIQLSELRSLFGIVSQNIYLFSGTILENIRFSRENATEEEVWSALKVAGAEAFVRALPNGLNEYIGPKGMSLSGGQRQRLAIARAYLKDPKILILDEATSALDSDSERAIKEEFQNLSQGKTTIIIAHRIATVQNADRIVVLENGEVVGEGVHSELVVTSDIYKRYWQWQIGQESIVA